MLNKEILGPLFAKYGKIYKPEEVIFREGDTPKNFYIVYNGKIKIELNEENSTPTIINIIGDGEIFGEMSLIDKQKRSASAISIEESKLIELDENIFYTLMGKQKSFIINIFRTLVNRVIRLSDIAAKLSQRDEKTRVYISMANFVKSFMKGNSTTLRISSYDLIKKISEDIHIHQEEVAKYIDYLEQINKISLENEHIIISNVKNLLDYIGV
jgi:CRP-like cAMP-binding protein